MEEEKLPRWFLLYGGTSQDGAGPGVYEGRTISAKKAHAHHQKILANGPWNTGYVVMIDDSGWRHIRGPYEWGSLLAEEAAA